MANWYGSARTNYVHITDLDALIKALEGFDVNVVEGCANEEGMYAFFAHTDSGGFAHERWTDDADEAEEFDFIEHVMPYVADGEVLIVMESGAEKLRYITGDAYAYIRRGSKIEHTSLHLHGIYRLAADAFGVPRKQINIAEY